jgi:hypothetical protein
MIQRIQTVWLLLSAVLFGLALLPSIFLVKTNSPGPGPFSDSVLQSLESPILTSGGVASAVLALIAIFLFKNRTNQILVASMLYRLGKFEDMRMDAGMYFGLAGVLFVWLASRAIRKDEEKVKSMDRLR